MGLGPYKYVYSYNAGIDFRRLQTSDAGDSIFDITHNVRALINLAKYNIISRADVCGIDPTL